MTIRILLCALLLLALTAAAAAIEPPPPAPGSAAGSPPAATAITAPQHAAWRQRAANLAAAYQAANLAEAETDDPAENRRLRHRLLALRRDKAELLGDMVAAQVPLPVRQEIEALLTPIPPPEPGYQ